jgi:hypothetical protein
VENLGADRLVYGKIKDAYQDETTAAKLPSMVAIEIEPGETYDFVIETKHLKFFDKASGLKAAPISL